MARNNRSRRERRERQAIEERRTQLQEQKQQDMARVAGLLTVRSQNEGRWGSKLVKRASFGLLGIMGYGLAVKYGDGIAGFKVGVLENLPNMRNHVPDVVDVPSHASNAVASAMLAQVAYSGAKLSREEGAQLGLGKVRNYYDAIKTKYIAGVVALGTVVNFGMEYFSGMAASEAEESQRILGGLDPVDVAYGAVWAGVAAVSQMKATGQHLAHNEEIAESYFEQTANRYEVES